MPYTVTAGAGSNVAVGTNPTPAYPTTGLGAGKLAIQVCWVRGDVNGTLTPPAGWTQQGPRVSVVTDNFQSIFSRELDGSETPGGTIVVQSAGTTGRRVAWIFVVDAPGGTGWNFENITSVIAGAGQTTISDKAVTTGGDGRLAVNVIGYANRQTLGQESFVGETGGTWTPAAYFESGSPPTLSVQVAELPTAGTIDNGVDTTINATPYIIQGFSIWRNASQGQQPDLVIEDISWSANPTVGQPVTLSALVHNVGAGDTPSGVVHGVSFTVSSNVVASSTSRTAALAAGASVTLTADAAWVPSTAGTFSVVATVDPNNLIAESNETNNTFSKDIVIAEAPPVGNVTQFNGRGPDVNGNITPVQADYDVFFLTQAEGDSRYAPIGGGGNVTSVFGRTGAVTAQQADYDTFFLTQAEGDARYASIGSGGQISSVFGRTGAITAQQADYDAFFLTQAEGDARYASIGSGGQVNSVFGRTGAVVAQQADYDSFFLTPAEGDSRYLTQAQANAQGMPAVELGGTGTSGPIREVNANFTLLVGNTPVNFFQLYVNIGTADVTAAPPSGYQANTGLTSVLTPGEAGLFIKRAGVLQFRRVS